MKTRTFLTLGTTLILTLLAAETAMARGERAVARYVPELFILLFALFGKLAGLGTVLGAGIFARGKHDDVKVWALLVAAIGGIWTAYDWFDWPYVTMSQHLSWDVLLYNLPAESREFSFLRLIGVGVFAATGAAVCFVITESKGDDGNRNG